MPSTASYRWSTNRTPTSSWRACTRKTVESDAHPLRAGKSASRLSTPAVATTKTVAPTTTPKAPESSAVVMDPLSLMAAQREEEGGDDDVADAAGSGPLQNASRRDEWKEMEEKTTNSESEELWRKTTASMIAAGNATSCPIRLPEFVAPMAERLQSTSVSESKESVQRARADLLEARTATVVKTATPGTDVVRDGLSARQFAELVELINNQLAKYWRDDKRVQVVKLTIQVAKLIGEPDPTSLRFYPALFAMLSELISYLGQLIYDRLVSKCPGLRVNFSADDVSESAREIAKNWLLKIVSIRELVPRILLQIGFLRCYKFLSDPAYSNIESISNGLTMEIRGVTHPIVASYLRMYLVKSAHQVMFATSPRTAANVSRLNFQEWLSLYSYFGTSRAPSPKFSGISAAAYLELYSPAARWLIAAQQIGLDQKEKDLVIRNCLNEVDNSKKHPGLVYCHLLDSASSSLVASQVTRLAHVVSACEEDVVFPACKLVCALGRALIGAQSQLSRHQKLSALSSTWKVVMAFTDVEAYLSCAEVWSEFTALNFGLKEVNALLGDVVAHVTAARNDNQNLERASKMISKILRNVLDNSADPLSVLVASNFLPVFDLVEASDAAPLAKHLIDKVINSSGASGETTTSDPVCVGVIVYLCENLAESVNALSVPDEFRQVSDAVSRAIRLVDHGEDDPEAQLQFLTDCRGKFSGLDAVQTELVHCVNTLADRARKRMASRAKGGRIGARGKGFLQACCAYAFITIPSIASPLVRLQLSLQSALVAYSCRCYGQAEEGVRATIEYVIESGKDAMDIKDSKLRSEYESRQVSLILQLISALLAVPDTATAEMTKLPLVRSALNASSKTKWADQGNTVLIYAAAIKVISVSCREVYPYKIANVDGNDVFYGSDPDFLLACDDLSSSVLIAALDSVQTLESQRKRSSASLVLFQTVVAFGDLESNAGLASLAWRLWKEAIKGMGSKTSVSSTAEHAKRIWLLGGDDGSNRAVLAKKISEYVTS